jgi:Fe-S-cluster containining protein
MVRATPFSYACGRCGHCCHEKGISLNPYEVLRLARNRGVTTTEFIARYTDTGGTRLAQRDDGACVFLTKEGCGVHPDRPLVCRIYPLARHVSPEREETFSELEPHPQTAGRYGTSGTVGDFLESHGAETFIRAVDRYLDLYGAMADSLAARIERLSGAAREAVGRECARPRHDSASPSVFDVDRTVDEYCSERGVPKPADVERLTQLHLEAVLAWSNPIKEEEAS